MADYVDESLVDEYYHDKNTYKEVGELHSSNSLAVTGRIDSRYVYNKKTSLLSPDSDRILYSYTEKATVKDAAHREASAGYSEKFAFVGENFISLYDCESGNFISENPKTFLKNLKSARDNGGLGSYNISTIEEGMALSPLSETKYEELISKLKYVFCASNSFFVISELSDDNGHSNTVLFRINPDTYAIEGYKPVEYYSYIGQYNLFCKPVVVDNYYVYFFLFSKDYNTGKTSAKCVLLDLYGGSGTSFEEVETISSYMNNTFKEVASIDISNPNEFSEGTIAALYDEVYKDLIIFSTTVKTPVKNINNTEDSSACVARYNIATNSFRLNSKFDPNNENIGYSGYEALGWESQYTRNSKIVACYANNSNIFGPDNFTILLNTGDLISGTNPDPEKIDSVTGNKTTSANFYFRKYSVNIGKTVIGLFMSNAIVGENKDNVKVLTVLASDSAGKRYFQSVRYDADTANADSEFRNFRDDSFFIKTYGEGLEIAGNIYTSKSYNIVYGSYIENGVVKPLIKDIGNDSNSYITSDANTSIGTRPVRNPLESDSGLSIVKDIPFGNTQIAHVKLNPNYDSSIEDDIYMRESSEVEDDKFTHGSLLWKAIASAGIPKNTHVKTIGRIILDGYDIPIDYTMITTADEESEYGSVLFSFDKMFDITSLKSKYTKIGNAIYPGILFKNNEGFLEDAIISNTYTLSSGSFAYDDINHGKIFGDLHLSIKASCVCEVNGDNCLVVAANRGVIASINTVTGGFTTYKGVNFGEKTPGIYGSVNFKNDGNIILLKYYKGVIYAFCTSGVVYKSNILSDDKSFKAIEDSFYGNDSKARNVAGDKDIKAVYTVKDNVVVIAFNAGKDNRGIEIFDMDSGLHKSYKDSEIDVQFRDNSDTTQIYSHVKVGDDIYFVSKNNVYKFDTLSKSIHSIYSVLDLSYKIFVTSDNNRYLYIAVETNNGNTELYRYDVLGPSKAVTVVNEGISVIARGFIYYYKNFLWMLGSSSLEDNEINLIGKYDFDSNTLETKTLTAMIDSLEGFVIPDVTDSGCIIDFLYNDETNDVGSHFIIDLDAGLDNLSNCVTKSETDNLKFNYTAIRDGSAIRIIQNDDIYRISNANDLSLEKLLPNRTLEYVKVDTTVTTQPESGVTYYTKNIKKYKECENLEFFEPGVTYYKNDDEIIDNWTKVTDSIPVSGTKYYVKDPTVYSEADVSSGFESGIDYYTLDNATYNLITVFKKIFNPQKDYFEKINKFAGYVETSDVNASSEKTYYIKYEEEYVETDVSSGFTAGTTYYEKEYIDEYIETTDTTPDNSKTYYFKSDSTDNYVEISGENAILSEEDVFEKIEDSDEYVKIESSDIDTSKSYYVNHKIYDYVATTNEDFLNDFEDGITYYVKNVEKSYQYTLVNGDPVPDTTYYKRVEGYEYSISYDEEPREGVTYYVKRNDDSTYGAVSGLTKFENNTTYYTREYVIKYVEVEMTYDFKSDEEYYERTYVDTYVPTEDSSPDASKSYYELVIEGYEETKDTAKDSSKTYYMLSIVPKYTPTTDTTVDENKIYYVYNSSLNEYEPATIDRKFADGVAYFTCEDTPPTISYFKTSDETYDITKIYYEKYDKEVYDKVNTITYTEVDTTAVASPVDGVEYYEINANGIYVKSDVEFGWTDGITYYTRTVNEYNDHPEATNVSTTGFVAGTTYYEDAKLYRVSQDEEPISGKTYYGVISSTDSSYFAKTGEKEYSVVTPETKYTPVKNFNLNTDYYEKTDLEPYWTSIATPSSMSTNTYYEASYIYDKQADLESFEDNTTYYAIISKEGNEDYYVLNSTTDDDGILGANDNIISKRLVYSGNISGESDKKYFIITFDTTPADGKVYYKKNADGTFSDATTSAKTRKFKDTPNIVYYVKSGSNYVATTDTSPVSGTTYYYKKNDGSYVEDSCYFNYEPPYYEEVTVSSFVYYIKTVKYEESTDTTPNSSKTYYVKHNASARYDLTEDRVAYSNKTYYNKTDEVIDTIISYAITNDISPEDGKSYYTVDGVEITLTKLFTNNKTFYEKIGEDDYSVTTDEIPDDTKIYYEKTEVESDEKIESTDTTPVDGKKYYSRNVSYRTVQTTDETPDASKTYYEKELVDNYFKTEDTTVDSDKTYYTRNVNTNYVETSDESPVDGKSYYTKNINVEYVETSDTTPDDTKTYYTEEDGSYNEIDVSEGFSEGLIYYEKETSEYYTLNSVGETFDPGITYYEMKQTYTYSTVDLSESSFVDGTTYYEYEKAESGNYLEVDVSSGFDASKTYYEIVEDISYSLYDNIESFDENTTYYENKIDTVYVITSEVFEIGFNPNTTYYDKIIENVYKFVEVDYSALTLTDFREDAGYFEEYDGYKVTTDSTPVSGKKYYTFLQYYVKDYDTNTYSPVGSFSIKFAKPEDTEVEYYTLHYEDDYRKVKPNVNYIDGNTYYLYNTTTGEYDIVDTATDEIDDSGLYYFKTFVPGDYFETSDIIPDDTKTYYVLDGAEYSVITPKYSFEGNTYYEQSEVTVDESTEYVYNATSDTEPDPSKTYYRKIIESNVNYTRADTWDSETTYYTYDGNDYVETNTDSGFDENLVYYTRSVITNEYYEIKTFTKVFDTTSTVYEKNPDEYRYNTADFNYTFKDKNNTYEAYPWIQKTYTQVKDYSSASRDLKYYVYKANTPSRAAAPAVYITSYDEKDSDPFTRAEFGNVTNGTFVEFESGVTYYDRDSEEVYNPVDYLEVDLRSGIKYYERNYHYRECAYKKTTDTTPNSSKTYYTLDENDDKYVNAGTISSFEENTTYYEYGFDSSKTYYNLRKDAEYRKISRSTGEKFDINKAYSREITEKSYTETTDTSPIVGKSYYIAGKYTETVDEKPYNGKTYYTKTDETYNPVTITNGTFNSGTIYYELEYDAVDITKLRTFKDDITYYEYNDSNEYIETVDTVPSSDKIYYEIKYIETSDESPVSEKSYYTLENDNYELQLVLESFDENTIYYEKSYEESNLPLAFKSDEKYYNASDTTYYYDITDYDGWSNDNIVSSNKQYFISFSKNEISDNHYTRNDNSEMTITSYEKITRKTPYNSEKEYYTKNPDTYTKVTSPSPSNGIKYYVAKDATYSLVDITETGFVTGTTYYTYNPTIIERDKIEVTEAYPIEGTIYFVLLPGYSVADVTSWDTDTEYYYITDTVASNFVNNTNKSTALGIVNGVIYYINGNTIKAYNTRLTNTSVKSVTYFTKEFTARENSDNKYPFITAIGFADNGNVLVISYEDGSIESIYTPTSTYYPYNTETLYTQNIYKAYNVDGDNISSWGSLLTSTITVEDISGYKFDYWSLDSSGDSPLSSDYLNTVSSGSVTIYAIYKDIEEEYNKHRSIERIYALPGEVLDEGAIKIETVGDDTYFETASKTIRWSNKVGCFFKKHDERFTGKYTGRNNGINMGNVPVSPIPLVDSGIVNIGKYVFYIGGYNPLDEVPTTTCHNGVVVYDTEFNEFSVLYKGDDKLRGILRSRIRSFCYAYNDYIYIFGGLERIDERIDGTQHSTFRRTNSVERIDLRNGEIIELESTFGPANPIIKRISNNGGTFTEKYSDVGRKEKRYLEYIESSHCLVGQINMCDNDEDTVTDYNGNTVTMYGNYSFNLEEGIGTFNPSNLEDVLPKKTANDGILQAFVLSNDSSDSIYVTKENVLLKTQGVPEPINILNTNSKNTIVYPPIYRGKRNIDGITRNTYFMMVINDNHYIKFAIYAGYGYKIIGNADLVDSDLSDVYFSKKSYNSLEPVYKRLMNISEDEFIIDTDPVILKTGNNTNNYRYGFTKLNNIKNNVKDIDEENTFTLQNTETNEIFTNIIVNGVHYSFNRVPSGDGMLVTCDVIENNIVINSTTDNVITQSGELVPIKIKGDKILLLVFEEINEADRTIAYNLIDAIDYYLDEERFEHRTLVGSSLHIALESIPYYDDYSDAIYAINESYNPVILKSVKSGSIVKVEKTLNSGVLGIYTEDNLIYVYDKNSTKVYIKTSDGDFGEKLNEDNRFDYNLNFEYESTFNPLSIYRRGNTIIWRNGYTFRYIYDSLNHEDITIEANNIQIIGIEEDGISYFDIDRGCRSKQYTNFASRIIASNSITLDVDANADKNNAFISESNHYLYIAIPFTKTIYKVNKDTHGIQRFNVENIVSSAKSLNGIGSVNDLLYLFIIDENDDEYVLEIDFDNQIITNINEENIIESFKNKFVLTSTDNENDIIYILNNGVVYSFDGENITTISSTFGSGNILSFKYIKNINAVGTISIDDNLENLTVANLSIDTSQMSPTYSGSVKTINRYVKAANCENVKPLMYVPPIILDDFGNICFTSGNMDSITGNSNTQSFIDGATTCVRLDVESTLNSYANNIVLNAIASNSDIFTVEYNSYSNNDNSINIVFSKNISSEHAGAVVNGQYQFNSPFIFTYNNEYYAFNLFGHTNHILKYDNELLQFSKITTDEIDIVNPFSIHCSLDGVLYILGYSIEAITSTITFKLVSYNLNTRSVINNTKTYTSKNEELQTPDSGKFALSRQCIWKSHYVIFRLHCGSFNPIYAIDIYENEAFFNIASLNDSDFGANGSLEYFDGRIFGVGGSNIVNSISQDNHVLISNDNNRLSYVNSDDDAGIDSRSTFIRTGKRLIITREGNFFEITEDGRDVSDSDIDDVTYNKGIGLSDSLLKKSNIIGYANTKKESGYIIPINDDRIIVGNSEVTTSGTYMISSSPQVFSPLKTPVRYFEFAGFALKVYSGTTCDTFTTVNTDTQDIVSTLILPREYGTTIKDIIPYTDDRALIIHADTPRISTLVIHSDGNITVERYDGTIFGKTINVGTNIHTIQEVDLTFLFDTDQDERLTNPITL